MDNLAKHVPIACSDVVAFSGAVFCRDSGPRWDHHFRLSVRCRDVVDKEKIRRFVQAFIASLGGIESPFPGITQAQLKNASRLSKILDRFDKSSYEGERANAFKILQSNLANLHWNMDAFRAVHEALDAGADRDCKTEVTVQKASSDDSFYPSWRKSRLWFDQLCEAVSLPLGLHSGNCSAGNISVNGKCFLGPCLTAVEDDFCAGFCKEIMSDMPYLTDQERDAAEARRRQAHAWEADFGWTCAGVPRVLCVTQSSDPFGNKLIRLPDLSHMRSLQRLDVSFNDLQVLPPLDRNIELVELDVSYNQLAELPDLSQLHLLGLLYANSNHLFALPPLASTAVNEICVQDNQIQELPDFRGYALLRTLACSGNPLRKLPPNPSSCDCCEDTPGTKRTLAANACDRPTIWFGRRRFQRMAPGIAELLRGSRDAPAANRARGEDSAPSDALLTWVTLRVPYHWPSSEDLSTARRHLDQFLEALSRPSATWPGVATEAVVAAAAPLRASQEGEDLQSADADKAIDSALDSKWVS
ncbi:yopM [Symbiodinium microadriaticum]|nr:yopM [Symbiodinium microadriaticum]